MLDLSIDGVFTIENPATGEWRTFRIETQSMNATFAPGKRVLGLLVGPSNSRNYKSFAFVKSFDCYVPAEPEPRFSNTAYCIEVWKSKKSESEDLSDYEKFAKLLNRLQQPNAQNYNNLNILPAVPCERCGELLTVPKSIRAGIGPVCAARA